MLAGLPIRSVGGWVLPRACHWTRTEANAAKVRRGGSRKEEDNEDGRGTGEGDGGDGGHTGSETYTIGSTLPGRRYVARYVDVSQPSTQPLLVQYRSLKSRLAWCDARTAALRASASSAVSTRLARFGALDGSPASIGPLRRLELSAGPVRRSNGSPAILGLLQEGRRGSQGCRPSVEPRQPRLKRLQRRLSLAGLPSERRTAPSKT